MTKLRQPFEVLKSLNERQSHILLKFKEPKKSIKFELHMSINNCQAKKKKDGKEIKYTLPLSPGVFTKSRETLIAKVIWMNFIWSETIFIDVTGIVLGIKIIIKKEIVSKHCKIILFG